MLTLIEYLLGMLLVGGVLFLLVSFVFGRGETLAPMPPDAVPVQLPEQRKATADDVRLLRLPVVLRGYRMHEVDWVLDRLADELELRDAEIARLRAELAGEPPPTGSAGNGEEAGEQPSIWAGGEAAASEPRGAERARGEPLRRGEPLSQRPE